MPQTVGPCLEKGVLRALVPLVLMLALAGCYESEVPAFDEAKSDALPRTGQFVCSVMGMAPMRFSIREETDGMVWKTYRYYLKVDNKPEDLGIFRKIEKNFYVGQGRNKKGGYSYLFLIFPDEGGVVLAAGSPATENLARSYGVEMRQIGKNFVLRGDSASLRKFLMNHSPDIVMKLARCRAER